MRSLGWPSFLILYILGFALFFANTIGYRDAKNQKKFLVIKSNPELLVLRKYSQKFICVTFNRENSKVENMFFLKSVDQIANEGLQIVPEEIGPIQYEEKEKVKTKKEEKEPPKKKGGTNVKK